MAHIGAFCPPISGHLNPMATLGRALQRRGHRVTFFQIPGMEKRIESEQLDFHPLGETTPGTDELAIAISELGRRSGLSALRFAVNCGRRLAAVICEYGPRSVRSAGIDLLLVDDNEPAGGSVAQYLGVPFVNLGLIPLYREVGVPPLFVPWPSQVGLIPALRNRLAYNFFELMIAPIQNVINSYRSRWKLPRIRRPEDTLSPDAQMSQLVAELDFPRVRKPECLHYLGALFDGSRPPVVFPYERLNGKPLVYASFGTLQNNRPEYFQAVAEACEPLDVQLVLSMGGRSTKPLEVPSSCIAVRYAPQLDLLSRAALCITHAGPNTVMESLRFGVPMVCVPITNDQPAVAARVAWAGAGEVIPVAKLNGTRLRARVEKVLGDTKYSNKARLLATAVQQAGGVEQGANIVLGVLNGTSTVAPARKSAIA